MSNHRNLIHARHETLQRHKSEVEFFCMTLVSLREGDKWPSGTKFSHKVVEDMLAENLNYFVL